MNSDPRSECLEWIRAQHEGRIALRKREHLREKKKRRKIERQERRRLWLGKRTVAGMHPGTGLWVVRVESGDHVTLRSYGVASALGTFAAVALDREQVAKLHQRLGNILEQWRPV